MKEQLITFETAKLAKEKGFFIRCGYHYPTENPFSEQATKPPKRNGILSLGHEGEEHTHKHEESGLLAYQVDTYLEAPTQSLLQKWLRERGVHVAPYLDGQFRDKWNVELVYLEEQRLKGCLGNELFKVKVSTFEEALEEGLKEALKLI